MIQQLEQRVNEYVTITPARVIYVKLDGKFRWNDPSPLYQCPTVKSIPAIARYAMELSRKVEVPVHVG